MKRDKKLQKYIDENLSEYRNDTFLEQLKSDLSPINTPTRRRNNRLYWTIAGATCVVMAIILVSVFAIAPLIKENGDKDTAQPSKYYSYANRTEITVSVTELNGVVNDIEFSEENLVEVRKVTDTFYNETLYYIINYSLNDGLDIFRIIIDVNTEYEYDFGNKPYNKFCDVNGYEIAYLEICEEGDGIYGFTGKAEIKNTSESIYIEYDGISLEQESNFIINLCNIIK